MNTNDNQKKPVPSFPAEDILSDIKPEFTKIFYDCNLNFIAEASEIFNIDKPSTNPARDTLGLKKEESEAPNKPNTASQKSDNIQIGLPKRPDFSPTGYLNSDVNFTTSYESNPTAKQGFNPIGFEENKNPNEEEKDFKLAYLKDYFDSQEYMTNYADADINAPLSLVWSNEPMKAHLNKLPGPKTSLSKKLKQEESEVDYTNMGKGFDYDESIGNEFSSLENSNDYYSKSDKDLSKGFAVKKEHHAANVFDRDMISHFERSEMRTAATEKASLTKKNSWPSSRKMSETYHDDDDDFGADGKNRSSRGLRVLSLKVKDIVSEKKRTSYKEVAECLIHELGQKSNGKILGESKDEQNVKRRVYDALNVLIASDILKKDGKAVYCDDKVANIGAHRRRKMKEDKDLYEKQMQEVKKRRKEKMENLEGLVYKCLAMKHLIKANQIRDSELGASESTMVKEETSALKNPGTAHTNATKIGVAKQSATFEKNEDVIKFPFIVLVNSTPENSMNMNMESGQKKLSIESSSPFHIYGDLDVLLKLGLHNVNQKFFRESIPKQIEKYLPKAYLDEIR